MSMIVLQPIRSRPLERIVRLQTANACCVNQEAEARINNNPEYSEQHKKGVLNGMEKGYLRNVKKIQDAQQDLATVQGLMDKIAPLYE